MRGLFALFWYRFRNWFRRKPGPGKPLRFLCGSKEELRRVTRWMCQADPALFKQELVIVSYHALEGDKGGFITYLGDFQYRLTAGQNDYLQTGAALIFAHNTFTGTQWIRDMSRDAAEPRTLFGYFEWPLSIDVEVVQPSLPEQVAARLAFAEWLDANVGEEERRRVLALADEDTTDV